MLNSAAKVQSFQNRYSKLDETIRGATVIISIWLQVSANLLPLPCPAWSVLPVEGFCKSSLVTITDYIAFQPGSAGLGSYHSNKLYIQGTTESVEIDINKSEYSKQEQIVISC